jgi:hypothetical protein
MTDKSSQKINETITSYLNQVTSDLDYVISQKMVMEKSYLSSLPNVSSITIPVPKGTDRHLHLAEIANYFKSHASHMPYLPFIRPRRSQGREQLWDIILHVEIECFPTQFKTQFTAKFGRVTFKDFKKPKPKLFCCKLGSIPSFYFANDEGLQLLGKVLGGDKYHSHKVLDYNGAFTNQAIFYFTGSCPDIFLLAPGGFINTPGNNKGIKILWNKRISCSHCSLIGHTIDFCPLINMDQNIVPLITERFIALNRWLSKPFVESLNPSEEIRSPKLERSNTSQNLSKPDIQNVSPPIILETPSSSIEPSNNTTQIKTNKDIPLSSNVSNDNVNDQSIIAPKRKLSNFISTSSSKNKKNNDTTKDQQNKTKSHRKLTISPGTKIPNKNNG